MQTKNLAKQIQATVVNKIKNNKCVRNSLHKIIKLYEGVCTRSINSRDRPRGRAHEHRANVHVTITQSAIDQK